MQRQIAFFSSDERPLYKADIYSSLALPEGYVVEFRYKRKYITPEILNKIGTLLNRRGIIFFTTNINSEEHGTSNISIREVLIRSIYLDMESDLFHFYLELGNFKEYHIDEKINFLPPHFFVSEIEVTLGTQHKWHNRVDMIKSSFPDHLFVKIQLIDKKYNEQLYPIYDPIERHSIFKMQDEKEYLLNIAFYHSKSIGNQREKKYPVLTIDEKTEQININSPEFIDSGNSLNNRMIRLSTKSISYNRLDSYITFKVVLYDEETKAVDDVLQQFSITASIGRQYLNAFLFGLFSTIAISSLALIAMFTASLRSDEANYIALFLGLGCAFVSSFLLYYRFNKTSK